MDNRVFIARCGSYDETDVDNAVTRALDAFGGVGAIAQPGQRVLIKPNLLMPRKPDTATTTHPAVVAAVCKLFIQQGCTVEIADSCGGPYHAAIQKLLYKTTGMADAAAQTGAILRPDTGSRKINTPTRSFPVIEPALEADVIVSVAKLKTHGLGHYTGAVKNMYGVLPGLAKAQGHAKQPDRGDFFTMVVDIYEQIKPSFCIIDGVVGMEGDGPSGGIPKAAHVIAAGINGHAVDAAAVWLMKLDEKQVPTLQEAKQRGLVPPDIDGLSLLGDEPVRVAFRPPASSKASRAFLSTLLPRTVRERGRPYPRVVNTACIGCGDCVRICPESAVHIREKKAHVYNERCIRCYCCHEICPVKAITLKKQRRDLLPF